MLNIDTNELENRWVGLNNKPSKGSHTTLRVAADCIPALFIGYNDNSDRCLILSLPTHNLVDIIGENKEHLSIDYFDESKHIIIKLKDKSFNDLFNDLIISLYQRIRTIATPKEAANQFIAYYRKWSEFFNNPNSKRLTLNEVQGLFGELTILQKLAAESTASTINDNLLSWVGPYDKGHDFVHDFFDLEVKTKHYSKAEVKISSEFQLDPEFDKELYLTIVSVDLNTANSKTLKNLILEIRDSIFYKLGDESILLKALNQKGLSIKNLEEYDNYSFEVKSISTYDCTSLDFPKLTISNIAPEISNITYKLRVSSLDSFLTENIISY